VPKSKSIKKSIPPLHHFLLVFDHRQGRLIKNDQYENSDEAVAAYSRAEREHEGTPDLEIVLIGSDSLETVKRTHANYFTNRSGARKIASRYLKGL
jgi:hypothetical protein